MHDLAFITSIARSSACNLTSLDLSNNLIPNRDAPAAHMLVSLLSRYPPLVSKLSCEIYILGLYTSWFLFDKIKPTPRYDVQNCMLVSIHIQTQRTTNARTQTNLNIRGMFSAESVMSRRTQDDYLTQLVASGRRVAGKPYCYY